jgi:peptide/nickel transport system substrate-binding protein
MVVSFRRALRLVLLTALLGIAPGTLSVLSQDDLPEVPRERTLVTQGWDYYNQIPSADNFNPYLGALLHARNNQHYTINESLFYYDYFTGEVIPWIASAYEYNDDYTEVTLTLRDGVTWSDGEALTAEDVVFTIDTLKANAPELQLSSAMNTWVESATATDDTTVVVTLTKPGPRWVVDTFATGQTARFVVLPQHIWEGQDAKTFAFFDIEQGWPVGTGPYTLVRSGDDSVIFDRRDSWWAVDAGLVEALPAPERIVYVAAAAEAMPQLYISNSLDMGRSLSIGLWEGARAQNPALITWNESGPVWGAPDGCVYRLTFNNIHPPFDDVDVRRAINHAIDRDEIVALAYEGSTVPVVAPLASFSGVQAYLAPLMDVIEASGVGVYDPGMTASILESKGYALNEAGVWADSAGDVLEVNITMDAGNPAGPVLAQQLSEAGFDVSSDTLQGAAYTDAARAGTFDLHLWVHCGSTYDPWLTLEHYHSKYSAPEGEPTNNLRAYTRYSNPELDALLDQMEVMVPSPADPAYMDLVSQALAIYLRDLPDISLAEELQVIPFNTTYWTGWPDASNPYTHSFPPWDGFALAIYNLQPTR